MNFYTNLKTHFHTSKEIQVVISFAKAVNNIKHGLKTGGEDFYLQNFKVILILKKLSFSINFQPTKQFKQLNFGCFSVLSHAL